MMTAPRQPRHRLADGPDDPDHGDLDTVDAGGPAASDRTDVTDAGGGTAGAPGPVAGVPAPAEPAEPPTQVLPIIPSQRAAVPQVFPTHPPAVDDRAAWTYGGSGSWASQPARTRPRRGVLPAVLAGVTVAVLALGVGVVVVESGAPADAAPVAGP